ncbi:MAG: hypothetical protein JNM62_10695 [Flavobacteriales bacterium]|nr:hypothetical protein [Flavobacteriales bacterium]
MLPSVEDRKLLGVPLRYIVVFLMTGIFAWNLHLRWEMLFQYRTELGGVEHNVVHGVQKLLLGQRLYEDPEEAPFDVIQYTPAYYLLCAGIGQAMGLAGDDARSVFLLSRTVALILNLLTCWYVFRCVRALGRPPWAALFVAMLPFCTFWEQFYARMDALSAAATFAAVHSFLRWLNTQERRALIACSAFGAMAVLSKQSGLVVLAAPAIHLLYMRQWRALGSYTLSCALILTVSIAAILLTLGNASAFYQNVVLGLRNGYGLHMYIELFNLPTYKYFVGWHVLAIYSIWRGARSSSTSMRFLAITLSASLLFALLTGLKYGSRLNYIHESLVLTFILGIAVLAHGLDATRRSALLAGFVCYGLLFAAFRTNSAMAWYRVGEPDAEHQQALRDDELVRDVLINDLHLRPHEHIFITYREYLEHFFVGQSVLTQKDIVQYSKDRLFDYTRFHDALRDGSVRFVVTDGPMSSITYLDSTYTGWHPVRTVQGRVILTRDAGP